MASNIVRFAPVISALYTSITPSYTKFGTPFDHAMRLIHFINDTNGTYMFSFDGVTDNVPVLANGFSLYDLTSDQDSNEMFRYEKGTQLWIKYLVAPTLQLLSSNTVYGALVYGKGE